MPDKPIPPLLQAWRVPECPFALEYDPAVLEEIRRLAVNAFHSLPHGGAEIGGVLFGTYAEGVVRIGAFRPAACQYAFGPSFVLSEKDLTGMADLLEASGQDAELEGLVPVGWYHSHTRSEIFLSEKDVEIHDRFFSYPWQVALVVRPNTLEPSRAGFFFWEQDGRMRTDKSYLELELRTARRKPPARRPEPGGADAQEERPAPAITPAAVIPAVEQQAPPAEPPPPVEPSHLDSPLATPLPSLLPPPAPRKPHVLPWAIAGVTTVIAIVLAAANTSRDAAKPVPVPPPAALPPALHLTAGEKEGQFQVRWDGRAELVRSAKSGTLEILDGDTRSTQPLSSQNLRNGAFAYVRQSEKVEVRLILQEPDGAHIEESTGFAGKLPRRSPSTQEQSLRQQTEELRTALKQEKKHAEELQREVDIQRDLLRRR